MKNKIHIVIALAISLCTGLAAFAQTANVGLAVFFASITASALAMPNPAILGATNVDAALKLNVVLDAAILAFKRAILPLTMFATIFRNVQLQGTDIVAVPYYPLDTSASTDFVPANGYVFDKDTNTQSKQITVNKRKYQPMAFTSAELARLPMLNAELLGTLKGQKLAYDVIQDVLSIVTLANYGAAVFTGLATTFDSDDVIDIRKAIEDIPWPETGRGLMVQTAYDAALLKDTSFKAAYAFGSAEAIRTGRLPNILGFNYAASPVIPANAQNLVGFAAYMSAILFASSPIEPSEDVKHQLTDYQVVTDPDGTGISFEYRQWGDPFKDTSNRVIECNYGYGVGEAAALKRMVSA